MASSSEEEQENLIEQMYDDSSSSSSSTDVDDDGHYLSAAVPLVALGMVAASHADVSDRASVQGHRVKRTRVRERLRDAWQSPWGLLLTNR